MRSVILLTVVTLAIPTAFAAPDNPVLPRTIQYHGIRPSDPEGLVGLRNPERGLRTEAVIAEPAGSDHYRDVAHLWGRFPAGYSDERWIMDAQRYETFGLTLVQAYCYLDRFVDGRIPEQKLQDLQRNLDFLRRAGLKAVLRFAYEKDMDRKSGPTKNVILAHMDQLAPVIRRNTDVVYVLQAGFVGAWGEWHSSAHAIEFDHVALAEIVAKLLDILPEDRMTQVRVPKYKRWVLSEKPMDAYHTIDARSAFSNTPAARIGFHNDGFLAHNTCGGTWTEPPFFSNPGNPEFDYMTAESAWLPVDGELFWTDLGTPVDGLRAAIRMRLHHYSSFSLAHSYSGHEGKPYSIDTWMKTPITKEQVIEAKLPLSDGYFEDADGNTVPRTQFDYIRDHLGYRIELREARFPDSAKPGEPVAIEVDLVNRGFSTFINPRPVYFVLIDRAGSVVHTQRTEANPRDWQPHAPDDPEFTPLTHTVKAHVTIPKGLPNGACMLGFWMPDASEHLQRDARYAVRAANRDVPRWTRHAKASGANILGLIEVRQALAPSQ